MISAHPIDDKVPPSHFSRNNVKTLFVVTDVVDAQYNVAYINHLRSGQVVVHEIYYPIHDSISSVHDVAERLAATIRNIQPTGPYSLLGEEQAGKLAFEIGKRLTVLDETIAFLGIINTKVDLTNISCEGDKSSLIHNLEVISTPENPVDMSDPDRIHRRHALDNHFPQMAPLAISLFITKDAVNDQSRDTEALGWEYVLSGDQIEIVSVETPTALGASILATVENVYLSLSGMPGTRDYAPLILLQQGKSKRAPVFCVPGAGANVVAFSEFAAALGEDYTVYGLQPRGLANGEMPHATIEAAAKSYVLAIDKEEPGGPFHLIGHSFGGAIIFEMDRQLRDMGRVVLSLTIVDGSLPERSSTSDYSISKSLDMLINIFEMNSGKSLNIDLNELIYVPHDDRLRLIHARLAAIGLVPLRSSWTMMRGIFRTFSANLQTIYNPTAITKSQVNLVLVRGKKDNLEDTSHVFTNIEQSWRNWCSQLSCWNAPGNHMTVLKQPNVNRLASWLRAKWL